MTSKLLMKRLYNLDCRNILIEGGNELTNNFIDNKTFNQFYLFKGSKKLSKLVNYKEFSGLDILKKKFRDKIKINSNFGKDTVSLYKN